MEICVNSKKCVLEFQVINQPFLLPLSNGPSRNLEFQRKVLIAQFLPKLHQSLEDFAKKHSEEHSVHLRKNLSPLGSGAI